MTNILRIKRRVTGAAGAPSSLKTGELAWNMADGIVYGGKGDDGSGNATSVVQIAKEGGYASVWQELGSYTANGSASAVTFADAALASCDLVRLIFSTNWRAFSGKIDLDFSTNGGSSWPDTVQDISSSLSNFSDTAPSSVHIEGFANSAFPLEVRRFANGTPSEYSAGWKKSYNAIRVRNDAGQTFGQGTVTIYGLRNAIP